MNDTEYFISFPIPVIRDLYIIAVKICLPKEYNDARRPELPPDLRMKVKNSVLEQYWKKFEDYSNQVLIEKKYSQLVNDAIRNYILPNPENKRNSKKSNPKQNYLHKTYDGLKSPKYSLKRRKNWINNALSTARKEINKTNILNDKREEYWEILLFTASVIRAFFIQPKRALISELVEKKYFRNFNNKNIEEIFLKYYKPKINISNGQKFYYLDKDINNYTFEEKYILQVLLFHAKHRFMKL